jgi:serine protease Do
VIGFQVGIISDYFTTDDIKGIGMVVPTGSIRQILDQLMESGFVSGQPHLGLEVEAISKLYQQYWQLPGGLLLTGISSSSDAAAKGLMEGDILLALDGKPVHERSDLYTILYNHKAGDTLIAVIRRDNQQFTVTLTIEDNSKNFDHEIS